MDKIVPQGGGKELGGSGKEGWAEGNTCSTICRRWNVVTSWVFDYLLKVLSIKMVFHQHKSRV